MMRTAILTILTVLVTALSAAAQPPAAAAKAKAQAERDRREDRRVEQVETFSRSVKVGAQGELDLQNMSGSVTVTRGSGNELKIDAVKKARAATEQAAREMLQLVTIEVSERAGRVEVRTRYPHFDRERQRRGEHRNMNVSVAYNITAPAGTRMRINSMSGGISVSDIGGELSLEAMSGHITVERAARLVAAKTMSGDVTVTDAKSDVMLTTGSMSGDVTLKQVTAREISAEVISGTITLIDVGCDRLGAQTTSGNVTFEGKLADRGRYKFGAHSGNIKIALTGDTGFELDANSWGGNVKSELALKNTEQGVADSRRARGGSGGRTRMLKGTYGDGSAVLDLSTFSGTILITRRVADGR
jgi:DUF4097 and DUF4098 domain-containing protein YvlB